MTPAAVVVVGGGLGGLRTVEGLRRRGYGGKITLVGAEAQLPYDRPPLSKGFLRGEIETTWLREEVASLDVEVGLGRPAVRLDAGRGQLILSDDSACEFDVAVLAPGSLPRRLPGVPATGGVHVLRTGRDALALRRAMTAAQDITVIGGGFIGCEVAATARSMGLDVTLVEAQAAPLRGVVGPAVAAEIAALHTGHGVRLLTGSGVAEVIVGDCVSGLTLTDGRHVDTATVLLALGVEPAVDWLRESGVELRSGIVCSDDGRTSLPNVYAVGDAASWYHRLAGGHRRVEHWTSTVEQADVVAANILGGDAHLVNAPYFWSDQYDQKIQAVGFLDPHDDVKLIDVDGRTVAVYSRAGTLTGVLGFCATRSVMRLGRLVSAGAPLSEAFELLGGQRVKIPGAR